MYLRPASAAFLTAITYLAVVPVSPTSAELTSIAEPLQFTSERLGDGPLKSDDAFQMRPVHPALDRIAGWISAVGAGVALSDLDGDRLSNDACHVDPRTDTVTVRPVPSDARRYAPLVLAFPAGPDPRTVAPMGCLPGDMNEDGRIDLLVYFWGRTPVAFLSRGASGAPLFSAAVDIAPGGMRWFSNAALFADVDGDTHADLLVGNYFPDGARILDPTASGREWMQQSMSRSENGGTKHLLRWTGVENGIPRFARVANWIPEEVERGWTLAAGAADLDGDLRPEFYLANDFGNDHLLYNRSRAGVVRFEVLRGQRGFRTPASKVVGRDSFKGMGIDFGDVNGDGRFDIYVSNIARQFALEESHFLFESNGDPALMARGVAPFTDRSEALGLARSGWAWDARLADFDNDGTLEALQATGFLRGTVNRWPELHELAMGNDWLLANPGSWPRFRAGDDLSGHEHNPLFVRRDGGPFHDVAALVGTGQPQVTRGLAVGDVDGDGLLDFAAANQWQSSVLYRNATRSSAAFLGLHILFGNTPDISAVRHAPGHQTMPAGSPAVGAVVEVRRAGGPLVAHVDGGTGHSGKRSPDVHFGLGAVPGGSVVDTVITWRTPAGVSRVRLALMPGWHTVWLPRHAGTSAGDSNER
jgi:hypothetical protein